MLSKGPAPPEGPPPSRSSPKVLNACITLPKGPPPAIDEAADKVVDVFQPQSEEEPESVAHVLIEQEPLVLAYARFLKGEALLRLDSPSSRPVEDDFDLPESYDVLISVCQTGLVPGHAEFKELQASVKRLLRRLQAGCRCFVFCDTFCKRADPDMDEDAYSKLRLKVFLYADIVVDIAGHGGDEPFGKLRDPATPSTATPASTANNSERTIAEADTWSLDNFTEIFRGDPAPVDEETPMGPMQSIPADQRGRVCLERFVSMAKMAMLKEEAVIEQLFVSSAPDTSVFIKEGAKVLTDASGGCESSSGGDLGEAMAFYLTLIEEYTAASEAAMHNVAVPFFQYLALHWDDESSIQRKRFAHFSNLYRSHVYWLSDQWFALSQGRVDSIKRGSRGLPWPILLVVGVPVILVLMVFAVPYNRPDDGYPTHGLLQNKLFLLYGWPLTQCSCWYIFPEWARMSAFPQLSVGFACVWVLAVTLIATVGIGGISVLMGVFPIPFLTVVNMMLVVPFLPLIWFCIPHEVRRRPDSKRRLLWSSLGMIMLIVIFGMFFPFFNYVFHRLSGLYQNFAVGVFISARIAFEKINKTLARRLDPNMYPLAVALAVFSYEFSMCVMMSSIKHSSILVLLVGADICENIYHIWFVYRKKEDEWHSEGSQMCIVSVMLLREFVELTVPVQLSAVVLAFHFGPGKQFNHLVSVFPRGVPPELKQLLTYLLVDILAEAVVFFFVCVLLRYQGFRPLCLLRGVLEANLGSYFAMAVACMMFYLQLQHSHFGCDFSFAFAWLSQQEGVSWSHGLAWSS